MTLAHYRERSLRHNRVQKILDTSELLILFIIGLWGLQLLLPWPFAPLKDLALFRTTLPFVPMPFHGVSLVILACIHMSVIALNKSSWRKRCIGGEVLFFLYVAWMLILNGRIGLDLAGVLGYIVFSAMNFHSLMRPVD